MNFFDTRASVRRRSGCSDRPFATSPADRASRNRHQVRLRMKTMHGALESRGGCGRVEDSLRRSTSTTSTSIMSLADPHVPFAETADEPKARDDGKILHVACRTSSGGDRHFAPAAGRRRSPPYHLSAWLDADLLPTRRSTTYGVSSTRAAMVLTGTLARTPGSRRTTGAARSRVQRRFVPADPRNGAELERCAATGGHTVSSWRSRGARERRCDVASWLAPSRPHDEAWSRSRWLGRGPRRDAHHGRTRLGRSSRVV